MVASIFGVAPRRHSLGSALPDTVSSETCSSRHPSTRIYASCSRDRRVQSSSTCSTHGASRPSSRSCRTKGDVVIIDSPPIGEAADALAFGSAVDAVLVAVRLGATQRTRLADLRRIFAQRGITATGVVLTTDRNQPTSHYYYASEHDVRPRLRGESKRKHEPEPAEPDGSAGTQPEYGQRAWPPRAPAQR